MNATMISEHERRIQFSTLGAVVFVGAAFLGFVFMVGAATYFFATGQAFTLSQWLVTMAVGLILGGVNGICFVRFFRRMVSVREVRLFENDTIEIVTWRGRTFMARMPENIKDIMVIGNDFSVTFEVEGRWFVVSSEELSERDCINDFFHRFVERYPNTPVEI